MKIDFLRPGTGQQQPALWKKLYTCGLLLLINLLNYVDRYTISPLLISVEDYFNVEEAEVGILLTIFVCFYMIFAPVFGYLGDRFNRKILLSIGIIIWSLAVIAGTLVGPDQYWAFVLFRGIIGIGEASYATIAPTLIADFFSGDARTRMLTLFYFGIPVGAGLGNVIGPAIANAFGAWQWGLRVSPIIGMCTAILYLFSYEPPRGASDGRSGPSNRRISYFQDLKVLFSNKTYICVTLGLTATTFTSGALAWWAPTYLIYSQGKDDVHISKTTAGLYFGGITAAGGIIGTLLGSILAQVWRKYNSKADLLVIGYSLVFSAPCLFVSIVLLGYNLAGGLVVTFIAITLLSFGWAVSPDIILYVNAPDKRASASGIMTLFGHILGDAISPYICGQIAEVSHGSRTDDSSEYYAFRKAFYLPVFILVLGGVFYLAGSFFVDKDRQRANQNDPKLKISPVLSHKEKSGSTPEKQLQSISEKVMVFPDDEKDTADNTINSIYL